MSGNAGYLNIHRMELDDFLDKVSGLMAWEDDANFEELKHRGGQGIAFFEPVDVDGVRDQNLHSFTKLYGINQKYKNLDELLKFVADQYVDGVFFNVYTCYNNH